MKEPLTQKDIKDLKYQCRSGYILPLIIFIVLNLIFILSKVINNEDSTNVNTLILVVIGCASFSILVSYIMNRNYIYDIRDNLKDVELKIITSKRSKIDYEAGSGTLHLLQEMKGSDVFSIVVENYRYRVDKNLYLSCNEGDEVEFKYAPRSRHLLSMELKKTSSI
jgi:hypothetical protein